MVRRMLRGATVLDSRNAAPLYIKTARLILEQATGGVLRGGAPLPSERSLAAALGVSRVTLRKALATLVEEGVVESAPGRGWFLTTGVLAEPPNALRSFTETAAVRGLAPAARVLETSVREATMTEAEALQVAPGSKLFELRRVRCLDGIAVACDESRVPLALAPGLVAADFSVASLYEELERAGHAPLRADYTVEAAEADETTARYFDLPPGAAVLRTAQTTYAADDRVVEIGVTTYRADRYRFRASLYRPPPSRRSRGPRPLSNDSRKKGEDE